MNSKVSKQLKIEYSICKPGGNDTAFVYGMNYDRNQKKLINDIIMKKHPNVEQVGFIDFNKEPELQMAGGEFCGNATRSAAYYYLKGKEGELTVKVNEKDYIKAGVYKNNEAWCEIPLYHGPDTIIRKEEGIYQVRMSGMVSIVIEEEKAEIYIKNKNTIKEAAMNFIKKYNLLQEEAVGVMFLENVEGKLQINPVVWVKAIDTLFYETACGSGTTATAMVQSYLEGKNLKIEILQPSGFSIFANVTNNNNDIEKVIISGKIQVISKLETMEIYEE